MRSLSDVIESCFKDHCYDYDYSPEYAVHENNSLYMEVPIGKETFEIPLLAQYAFFNYDEVMAREKTDKIVVELIHTGASSTYKTLDSKLRDALARSYRRLKLTKIASVNGLDKTYYAACGAIFDENFLPIMMMSWQVERVRQENQETGECPKYRFKRPIIRISPEVFISKGNAMERYIVNKIPAAALSITRIYTPRFSSKFFDGSNDNWSKPMTIKIEIDDCPFVLRKTDKPSISTTNKELLDIALDHIEEVVQ